jgi:predicted metal-dependent HD superfamily phosphohydrolase
MPADASTPAKTLLEASPLPLPEAWPALLAAAYGEGRRAYHTLGHVTEVLRHLAWAKERLGPAALDDEASVVVAVLFHDAVYDARAKDNEARSAALAREALAAAPLADSARVTELILATARHGTIDARETAADRDLALFLDCDMAILGAAEAPYDAYERGVAYEYAEAYPPAAFREGRAAFLEALVARPRLFATDLFHDAYDAPARANLRRAIAALRAAPPAT